MKAVENDEVSELLGMPPNALAEHAGGSWWRLDPARDTNLPPDNAWLVSGEPPQVMLGVDTLGDVKVATPQLRWHGHELMFETGQTTGQFRTRNPDTWPELNRAVRESERIRRAAFIYCRYCRTVTGPEHIHEDDICMSCASRYRGVVY